MKIAISIVMSILLSPCYIIYAQAPLKMSYQAIARDSSGIPIVNQSISIKFSILSGSSSGTLEYSETHNITTDVNGFFEAEIGGGNQLSGIFIDIEWGNNSHFLKVEIDPNGGSAYNFLMTSEFLSVPYALHSANVAGIQLNSTTKIVTDSDSNLTIGNSVVSGSSAQYNTIIGEAAGSSGLIGSQNTFLGHRAGQSSVAANHNVFIGAKAGNSNTTGSFNTYIGLNSGTSNSTGNSNTLIGSSTGKNMTGSWNVALGTSAGYYNTTGFGNVFIGTNSGLSNNGFKNVFIGMDAGANETSSHLLYVDNTNTSTPLIYGEFLNDLVRINGNLDVTGDLSIDGVVAEFDTDSLNEIQTLELVGDTLSITKGNSVRLNINDQAIGVFTFNGDSLGKELILNHNLGTIPRTLEVNWFSHNQAPNNEGVGYYHRGDYATIASYDRGDGYHNSYTSDSTIIVCLRLTAQVKWSAVIDEITETYIKVKINDYNHAQFVRGNWKATR